MKTPVPCPPLGGPFIANLTSFSFLVPNQCYKDNGEQTTSRGDCSKIENIFVCLFTRLSVSRQMVKMIDGS